MAMMRAAPTRCRRASRVARMFLHRLYRATVTTILPLLVRFQIVVRLDDLIEGNCLTLVAIASVNSERLFASPSIMRDAISALPSAIPAAAAITRRNPKTKDSLIACLSATRVSSLTLGSSSTPANRARRSSRARRASGARFNCSMRCPNLWLKANRIMTPSAAIPSSLAMRDTALLTPEAARSLLCHRVHHRSRKRRYAHSHPQTQHHYRREESRPIRVTPKQKTSRLP
jgi:hypothetical protein